MKQRLPFLRNRSLYRRRTIKFDRLDPSLVETPFLDLSFRVERSPFQRRRSRKRSTSVFQKRRRTEFPRRDRRSWARLIRPENETNIFYFLLFQIKQAQTVASGSKFFNATTQNRRVDPNFAATAPTIANNATRFTYFPYFSGDVKRRFRSIPENGVGIRSANKRASTPTSP